MKNYLNLLGKLIRPRSDGLVGVFGLFILLSTLEAISIGLIVPLFSILDLGYNSPFKPESVFVRVKIILENNGLGDPARLMVLVVFIFYIKGVLGYFTQRAIFNYGFKQQKRLIDGLVQKYQEMSVADFTKQESSVLIQNLIGNVEVVSLGSIVASIRLVAESAAILFISVVLIFAQPIFTLSMLLLITLVVLAYDRLFKKRIRLNGELAVRARENVIRNFQSIMQGFKEIRVIGRMDYFNKLIFEGTANVKNSAVEYKAMNAIPRYMMESAVVTGFAAIFIIGEFLGMSQGDILATIGTFAVAALRLIPAANQVSSCVIQIRNSYFALEKVVEGLDGHMADGRKSEFDNGLVVGSQKSVISQRNSLALRKIEFCNVMFRYKENHKSVLKDANLVITAGQMVCFKGNSGSGKSTSLDLILGFYSPTAGKVLINGQPLPRSSLTWMANFAYVSQYPFLFAGSIRDNIALGVPESVRGVSLSDSIRLACLEDFILEQPNGIDSIISESAANISGGQTQRIALARAFYLNRPVIILDEPTSALDVHTARKLINNIYDLRGKKTIIFTSHDSVIMDLCDVVYDFRDGRVY